MLSSLLSNIAEVACLAFICLTRLQLVFSLDSCQVDVKNPVGPYLVGRTTVTVVDEKNTQKYPEREGRTFPVDIWYPAKEGSDEPFSEYKDTQAFGIKFPSTVALDDPEVAEGQFPLLIFSHGHLSMRFQSLTTMEYLASFGYIIASAEHVGNSALDIILGTSNIPFELVDRPLDASLVIDEMLAFNSNSFHKFSGRIDQGKIGAMGHSFGSYTAAYLASGSSEDDLAADDRVKAILPMSPDNMNQDLLSGITIPTMVLSGSCDNVTPVQPNTQTFMKASKGSPRYRVDIEGGGHTSFSDICFFVDFIQPLVDAGAIPALAIDLITSGLGYDGACTPNLRDVNQIHNLTIAYSAAFFKTVFEEQNCSAYFDSSFAAANNLPVNTWTCSGDAKCEMEDEPEPFLGCGYTTAPTTSTSPTVSQISTSPKVSPTLPPTSAGAGGFCHLSLAHIIPAMSPLVVLFFGSIL